MHKRNPWLSGVVILPVLAGEFILRYFVCARQMAKVITT